MSWTSLDDKWDVGSKLLRAAEILKSDAAHAMWVRGITHCNRENTDGRIYGAVLRSKTYHRKPQAVVDALVKVGALLHLGGDEYAFHDFLEWNDSKEEVEAKRKRKQESGRRGGQQSGLSRTKQTGSKTEAGASDYGSKNEAGASRLLGSSFAFGSPGANTSPLHTSPSEISPETGSLPPPSERSRAPEAAAAAAPNPAVAQVLDALSREKPLRGVATTAFAQDLARFCNEHGFTGPRTLEATLTSIGEASAKVSQAENIGEPLGNRQIAALVHGCVRTGPRGSTGATAGRHRQPGLGHYEQTNAEDV